MNKLKKVNNCYGGITSLNYDSFKHRIGMPACTTDYNNVTFHYFNGFRHRINGRSALDEFSHFTYENVYYSCVLKINTEQLVI